MAETLKLGNGNWATKKESLLAYNSENNNFKPLPFNFTRDSGATRVNKEGLIEVVSNNEPRIDFKDSSEGSLLLEPSRTNLFPYSEDFENSDWTKNAGTTITNNYAISPDGTLNASRYLGTGASGLGDKFTLSSTSYTISFYVKSNTSENQFCRLIGDSSNISENLLITTEWTRLSYTFTGSGLSDKTNGIFRDSNNNDIDILIWGAQLEVGSYATSYIPTSGSAVTRVADSSSQTVPDGIIGQTEGSVYIDFLSVNNFEGSSGNLFEIKEDNNNRINIYFSNGTPRLYGIEDSSGVFNQALSLTTGSVCKLAIKYNSTSTKVFINGSLSHTLNGINNIAFNDYSFLPNNNIDYNEIKIYNTALTDQELISLTS